MRDGLHRDDRVRGLHLDRAPRLDAADPIEWWTGLVELYREEAGHAPSPRAAARHLCEAARICLDELGAPDRARGYYEEAHTLDPDDPSAARALADIAEADGDWTEAREWLESALQATADGTARASLLARLSGLLHERLGERSAAAACAREALGLAPGDRMVLARLQLVCDPDDPAARLLVLERSLDLTDAPDQRAALLVEAGRVHEAAHRDDDAALTAYRAAFVADPDHPPALDGIVRIMLRHESWDALVETLADAVGRIADERARGRLHVLAALVLGVRLDAPERARPHLGAAAASLGHDPVAMAEIAGLYERLGAWKQANAVLERQATSRAGVWYRIGLNIEAGSGDAGAACEAYRRAIGADAEALPALAALRRCAWRTERTEDWHRAMAGLIHHARDPAVRAALASHLADVRLIRDGDVEHARRRYADAVSAAYEAAGDTPLLLPTAFEERTRLLRAQGNLPVLEEELRSALARPLHPSSRAMVAGQLAALCEGPLGRPEEALTLFGVAVAHDPDDRYAHEARQRLLWARGDWPALLEALGDERARAETHRRRLVLTRIADVQHDMGDPEGAEATWRATLDIEPDWLPALRGLGRQLHQHGRWRDLAALHHHELDTLGPDDPRRVALLCKVAELNEFRLDQPDEAIECYEALLALRPGAPEAVAGLERLYRQSERWAALTRVLAGRASQLDDPRARAAVLIRLADVYLERLDDAEGARAAYEEAARLTPGSLPAGWAIERLALADGDLRRLSELYRGMLAHARTPGQKAIARHKLAAVVDPIEAEEALETAVADDGDPEAGWALVRQSAEVTDRARVAGHLAGLAQRVEHRRDALALWREAAEQGHAAALPAAELTPLWHRIRQLDPEADRPWVALLGLHRRGRIAGAEAELLLQRAEVTADPREKSIALWTAGLIEEGRGMPSVGLDAFREALTACPTDPVPPWLLLDRARHARVELDPADHADQLVTLARRQSNGPGAAQNLLEAGRLHAEKLDDMPGALGLWLEAVRRDPGAREAAEKVESLLEGAGAWAELATLLSHRAERLDDAADRVPLLRRLADVQLERLGQRPAAAETLEELVLLAPADLDARVRLGDLRYSLDQFAEAAAHYRTATMAAHDDRLLGRLYTRLGRIKGHHLGDHAGAIEDLRRAVGLGTDDAALGELARVYLVAGEADLALMAYQRLEKLADAPAELSAARAGQVHALLRRGRRSEAVERLEAFRENDPVDPMLATLARDLGLAPLEPGDDPGDSLMRPPGRALAAGTLGALRLDRRAADGRANPGDDSLDGSLDALDLEPSVDRAFAAVRRATISEPPPSAPSFDGLPEIPEISVDIPISTRPPAAAPIAGADPALEQALAADLAAAFDALAETPHPLEDTPRPAPGDDRAVEAVVIPSPLDASIEDDLAVLTEHLDPYPGGSPFDGTADTGSVQTIEADGATGSLPSLAAGSLPRRAAERARYTSAPPSSHAPDDGEALFSGSLGGLDFDEPLGEPRDQGPPSDAPLFTEPFDDDLFGDSLHGPLGGLPDDPGASAAAALLEALPNASLERRGSIPRSSDVVNLLQPDIDRAPSGSLPPLRDRRAKASADEHPSMDVEGSTNVFTAPVGLAPASTESASKASGWTPSAPDPRHASGKLTTPLSPVEVAVERLKLAPLDREVWRGLHGAVSGPVESWIGDAAGWVEGEVQPGRPTTRQTPLPRALGLAVRPAAVPGPLGELLAELAPLLIEPVLAEGRRRTSGSGGERIPPDAPLGRMASRYARLLGLDDMELVQNPERPYSVNVEPGDSGLRLVLGSAIVESADPAGRSFLLARTMAPVAFGTLAARQLRQRESRAFFGALFEVMGADFPMRGRDRRQVERFREALSPYVGAVDDHPATVALARRAAEDVRRNGIAGLRAGLELFDNRLALALSDGFGGALEMLRLLDFDDRPRGALGDDELHQLVADSDIARDLLVFAATPECHAIRRWLATDE